MTSESHYLMEGEEEAPVIVASNPTASPWCRWRLNSGASG